MAGITFPKELIKQNEKKSTCDYCRNKDIYVNTQKIYWSLRAKLMDLK